MARPSKLNKDVQERICNALRRGLYVDEAARYGGIDPATYHRWMNDDRPTFREFREAVEKVLAECEFRYVGYVEDAASGAHYNRFDEAQHHWQAAAWLLERRFPDRWRRRTTAELTGPGGGAIQISDLAKAADEIVNGQS